VVRLQRPRARRLLQAPALRRPGARRLLNPAIPDADATAALARVLSAILGKKLHEREPIIGTFLYRSEQGITIGAIVPSDAYRGALTRMGLR
jgi:hypothetical protein